MHIVCIRTIILDRSWLSLRLTASRSTRNKSPVTYTPLSHAPPHSLPAGSSLAIHMVCDGSPFGLALPSVPSAKSLLFIAGNVLAHSRSCRLPGSTADCSTHRLAFVCLAQPIDVIDHPYSHPTQSPTLISLRSYRRIIDTRSVLHTFTIVHIRADQTPHVCSTFGRT